MKQRRRFSPEFKDEAVRLVLEENQPLTQVAAELGVGKSSLQKWRREHLKRSSSGSDTIVSEVDMAEFRQLQKDNRRLKMEVEILKKATAYFAKESQ